jgi:prephenate dehydrogenase
MPQSRIVICGVGLIGGSFALALKKSALALRRDLQVVGMGRTRAPLEQALRLGVIDVIATDWASALDGADLVLLGMPVGQMAAVMEALAPHLQAAYDRHRRRQHQVRRCCGGPRSAR